MKKLLALLLVCCSTMAYGQTTEPVTPTETTHQMGDDGYIQVTLPFNFTFYDRTFTESWMYDNGIISFIQPGQPNSISNYQWSAYPLDQANANYFIASLWADIAPVGITKYITQTDGTYMKYIWQDIAEYYSQGGNLRLNTFSTTLKDDGTIETHYTNINLQTSAISVGTVGDRNLGEYNQIYYSPCCNLTTTGMISDWTIYGAPTPPKPEVVTQPEVYVAPQYTEETITETTSAVVTVVEPETIVTTTPTTVNTTAAIVQAATESSPASVTTASIAATVASSDSSSNKMSIADAQSIARTNQKSVSQLVSSVVNSSIENSISLTTLSDNEVTSFNDTVVSTSTSQSISSVNNSVNQSSNSVSDTGNNSYNTSTSVNLANFSRLPGSFSTESEVESVEQKSIVVSIEISDVTNDANKPTQTIENMTVVTDETNPTSVRSLAANSASLKQLELEEEQEKKNIEIADLSKDTSVSELATLGVQLTELQVLPIGYNIYLATVLKDASFYAPKAIYRNQTVVDNAPAQRLLKFASDAKFDQMVSQQYGEQK